MVDVVNVALFNSRTVWTGYSCEKLLVVPTYLESASLPRWFLCDSERWRKMHKPSAGINES